VKSDNREQCEFEKNCELRLSTLAFCAQMNCDVLGLRSYMRSNALMG
jgi:hypothetical protein